MIGRQLGHFTVVERLGSGAMGVVYRARDNTLERDVALKVLAGGPLDPSARDRLRKEARALSRAVHPSIATVHDFGSSDDVDFIVMELVEGLTVAQRLAAGPLSQSEVLDLGRQLAAGLVAAHAAGVIHRDVKPGNLKITPEGRLKILDFGVAILALGEMETTRSASSAGVLVGTLPYMSPEQLRGGPADVRTDVYAAGAVLYEMATGTRAFPESQEGRLFEAILQRPVVAPRTLQPELSPQLEACILRALEKDPARRYQSATDLNQDLGVAAALAGIATGGAPPQRRSRRGLIIGTAIVVALAGVALRPYVSRFAGAPRSPVASNAATGTTGAIPVSARPRLAVVPPQNLSNRPGIDAWLPLVQSLFTAELTGIRDLGVIDPQTLDVRLAAAGSGNPRPPIDQALADLQVSFTIDSRILPAGSGFQLQANLVDLRSSEVRFTVRQDLSGEVELPHAVKAAAQAIVSYFDLQVIKVPETGEMRPWISLREHNIEAVKAFVQANQYLYRYQFAEVEPLLRRAIQLDPTFVAPRLWLIAITDRPNAESTRTIYEELKRLAPTASPFDQAMIGFAGAMLADDVPGQIRYLQVALEYSPGNNILLVNLANARAAGGDCEGALRDVEPALRMRWAFPPLYTLAGVCAIRTRQFDQARRVLDIAISLPAVDPNILGLRAGLETAVGEPARAAPLFGRYAATQKQLGRPLANPILADIYDMLGRDCGARGEKARAAALFEMRDRLSSK